MQSFTDKLKLADINEYDDERIVRENASLLTKKNKAILSFVQAGSLPADVSISFLTQVRNNAAEILYGLSIANQRIDLNTYEQSSPLFRGKDGSA